MIKNNISQSHTDKLSIEEQMALVESPANSLKMKTSPVTKEETREIYHEHP